MTHISGKNENIILYAISVMDSSWIIAPLILLNQKQQQQQQILTQTTQLKHFLLMFHPAAAATLLWIPQFSRIRRANLLSIDNI